VRAGNAQTGAVAAVRHDSAFPRAHGARVPQHHLQESLLRYKHPQPGKPHARWHCSFWTCTVRVIENRRHKTARVFMWPSRRACGSGRSRGAEVKGCSGVQGCKGAKDHRCTGARVQGRRGEGCRGAKEQRSTGAQVQGCRGAECGSCVRLGAGRFHVLACRPSAQPLSGWLFGM
jgi:hypothetical protein